MMNIDTDLPVLVTGATGYVAGQLVQRLLEAGLTVHAAVRNPDDPDKLKHLQRIAAGQPGTIRYFRADLLEPGSYAEAMAGCGTVFHTASPFTITVRDPQKELVDPALLGTRNVLDTVNRTPSVRRVVLTSSCAAIYGDTESVPKYRAMARDLKGKLFDYFWDETKQAFIHNRIDGTPSETVTRYTNMFAIFFDYLNDTQKQAVKTNVLLNDEVMKITTPYMRFYELEALCATGDYDYVMSEIKSYWGGMLDLGATSFWEKYDPTESGVEHWAMYAKPYRKSLCHAWGASPIYLLGKYFAGVKPTGPGYETYVVEPVLGGLEWFDTTVPTPDGCIELHVSGPQIRVKSDTGTGKLRFASRTKPEAADVEFTDMGGGRYEMTIEPGIAYTVAVSLQ